MHLAKLAFFAFSAQLSEKASMYNSGDTLRRQNIGYATFHHPRRERSPRSAPICDNLTRHSWVMTLRCEKRVTGASHARSRVLRFCVYCVLMGLIPLHYTLVKDPDTNKASRPTRASAALRGSRQRAVCERPARRGGAAKLPTRDRYEARSFSVRDNLHRPTRRSGLDSRCARGVVSTMQWSDCATRAHLQVASLLRRRFYSENASPCRLRILMHFYTNYPLKQRHFSDCRLPTGGSRTCTWPCLWACRLTSTPAWRRGPESSPISWTPQSSSRASSMSSSTTRKCSTGKAHGPHCSISSFDTRLHEWNGTWLKKSDYSWRNSWIQMDQLSPLVGKIINICAAFGLSPKLCIPKNF